MTEALLSGIFICLIAIAFMEAHHYVECRQRRRKNDLWMSFLIRSHYLGVMSRDPTPDDEIRSLLEKLRAADKGDR